MTKLGRCDGIIISCAEHNGSYTSAYKNSFDWCSRIEPKVFQQKPLVLLLTSPGSTGGASVLALAVQSAPYLNGKVKASFSLPSFFDNFDEQAQEISHPELNEQFIDAVSYLNHLS